MSRTVKISIRFNEEEFLKFRETMNDKGYNSMSRFIRDSIFNNRMPTRKIDTSSIEETLNSYLYQFKKIGVNYNQVVRNYGKVTNTKNSKGEFLVNNRSNYLLMTKMKSEIQKAKETLVTILEVINNHINN